MIRILLCDDEVRICSELEDMIREYTLKYEIEAEIEIFYSGESLQSYMSNQKEVDLVFLDIEFSGVNGIDVGKYIREVLENEYTVLVYISWKMQYAMELFQNRPFDFLIKPLEKESVWKVLEKIFKLLKKENLFFEFQSNYSLQRVPYKDIFYFQSKGKKIEIVTKKGIIEFYGKLQDAERQFPSGSFLKIHKSFRIHSAYVQEYHYEWVKMINGDILSISKVNRTEIKRRLLNQQE